MTPNDPRWISRPISFVAVIKLMNITWVTWSYHVSCRRNSDVDRKKKKKEEERRRRNWSNIRSCGCAGRIKKKKKKLKQYKILRLRRQDKKLIFSGMLLLIWSPIQLLTLLDLMWSPIQQLSMLNLMCYKGCIKIMIWLTTTPYDPRLTCDPTK